MSTPIILNHSLLDYNSIIKENDDLYRNVAKSFGLSDCAMWILYVMREQNKTYTQTEICNILYQPKQTINSTIKKLVSDGYIVLNTANDKRSKELFLTPKGIAFCEKTVDIVLKLEQEAISSLTEDEQETFLNLFHKLTDILSEKINSNIKNTKK